MQRYVIAEVYINIYHVFRMHFADAICTYYLRYSFYKNNICIKLKKCCAAIILKPFWALGCTIFQYIRGVLNNVLKSIVQIIKMSLLVIQTPSDALYVFIFNLILIVYHYLFIYLFDLD